MKKVAIALAALVCLLFLIQALTFSPVSQIEQDGYAVNSTDVEKRLTGEAASLGRIELLAVQEMDAVYEQMGARYVGEEKEPLNVNYPMYFNDATGILFLSDKGTLYDENFDIYTVKENTMVSNGALYSQFQVRQGSETYLFFACSSGVLMNTKAMHIKTAMNEYDIPLNSMLSLEENAIRYYIPVEGALVPKTITDMEQNSAVEIGGKQYAYQELLVQLNLASPERQPAGSPAPSAAPSPSPSASQPAPSKTQEPSAPAPSGGNSGQGGSTGGNGAYRYIQPEVEISGYSTTVYSASSSVKIYDPQGHLYKGRVEVQVWRDGKVYMRKYFRRTQNIKLTGLEPGQKYKIVTQYQYEGENGEQINKVFDEIQIKTQDFSTLTPIRFSFESGEILAKQLKIVNWKLESSPNEESMQNVARVVVEANGSKYGVKSMQIQNLRDGESIKFETDESLPSDSKISYIIRAYDVFGNEMVLENNKGETRTCKQTPKVKIKVVTNKVSDVQLQIQLTNPDHVDLEDYRLTATDTSGNLVWQGEIPDSNISFNNLDAGKVLNLRITASMDVEDGRGMQEDVLLADTQIVTVPLSSLGNIGALLNIIEVKADSVSFRYKVDTMRTNPMILELMTQMSLSITDASGQVISKELTPEQLAEIKAGNEIQLEFDNLNSRTIYQFSVSTVLKHGTSFYTDFKTNLSTRNFQTLRRSTWIEMRGLDMKEDTFTFEARAIDLDGAVTDGYVGMRVYGPSGVVVDVLVIDTVSDPEQGGWTSYTYTIPSESDWNSAFRFEFYAVEYNEGYNAITRKTNHIIDTVVLATPTSVAGSLGLASIESSSAGEEQRLVNFQYTVYDKGGNVKDKAYYFTVYSDDEQIGTYEYSMGEGVSYISEKEQAFFLDLELGREYRAELWVENTGSAITTRQVLGEVRFDTLYNVKPIRTPQELYDVANDPDAHYIVLNDLDLNAVRGKIDVAFTGQINFMGHTVKFSVDEERQYLFKNNRGSLQGAVLEISFVNAAPLDVTAGGSGASGFVHTNSGTIQNIMAYFDGTPQLANDGIGGIIYQNTSQGILNNFTIYARGAMHAKRQASYGVALNSGTVRNGYVYGASLDASYPTTVVASYNVDNVLQNSAEYRKSVGGIVGYNDSTGLVSNVYSLANVKMATLPDPSVNTPLEYVDEVSVGNIVGFNVGTVQEAYSYGEEPYEAAALGYGPAVGKNLEGTKENRNTYYISDFAHSNTKLNKRVTKLQLYDMDFQNATLNGGEKNRGFDVSTYTALGYYPQVKMPSYMPGQPLNEMPQVDTNEAVDIKSIEVLEHTDNTALVELVLNNPGSGNVQFISVGDIGRTQIKSQVHEGKYTTVQIEISSPGRFVSSYYVRSVRIVNNFGGTFITRNYKDGDQEIAVDFFRDISSVSEWSSYVTKNSAENHKLLADLDFTGWEGKDIHVAVMNGILDGNGHTISNIDVTGTAAYYGLVQTLRGTIRNLTVDGLTGDRLQGLVYTAPSGSSARFDHVFLRDVLLDRNGQYTGSLLGLGYSVKITNCGADGVTIRTTESNLLQGGLVGQLTGSTTSEPNEVRNCYVTNLLIEQNINNYPYGTGGIVGRFYYGEMSDCYVSGEIITNRRNVGGIVGVTHVYAPLVRVYADVNITANDNTGATVVGGGISGAGSTANSIYNAYSQGNIYNQQEGGVLNRVSGSTINLKTRQVYAAADQLVNGVVAPLGAEQLTGLLTYEQLLKAETFSDTIGLGSAFSYSGVAEGFLPKLLDSDGVLLPGQRDLPIKGKENLTEPYIREVKVTNATDLSATLEIYIEHRAGVEITGANVEYLESVDVSAIVQDENTTVLKMDVKPTRYYDSYTITGITGKTEQGQAFERKVQAKVEQAFYKLVATYDDWQDISNNTENYKLTADIDFTGRADSMHRNFTVNRFVGVPKADGTNPVLKNISLELVGGAATSNTANVFSRVEREFSNVDVEGYSLYIENPARYTSSVGFIYTLLGKMDNVNVRDMSLCVPRDKEETGYGTYVGFVAMGHSWFVPVITNVTGENLQVYGNRYVGGLFGANFPSITQVNVQDSYVKARGYYGGILLGYNGNIYSSCVENSTLEGGALLGGMAGLALNIQNSYVKNVRVEAELGGAGGLGGRMNAAAYTLLNNYVIDSTVISKTGRAGGLYGGTNISATGEPAAPDSSVRTFRNCGVMGSTIVGKEAGGIAGGSSDSIYGCFVRDTSVTGESSAGGLVGVYEQSYDRKMDGNLVQAEVTATGANGGAGAAGGLIGTFNNDKNAAAQNLLSVSNNIYVGSGAGVVGANYAGGLIGRAINTTFKTNKTWNGNIIMAGPITSGGAPARLQVGNIGGATESLLPNMKNLKAHSQVSVGSAVVGNEPVYQSWGIVPAQEEYEKTTFYTGIGFLNGAGSRVAGNPYWGFDRLVKDGVTYLPYDYMGYDCAAYSGPTGKTVRGQQLQQDLGDIPVPAAVTTFAALRQRSASFEPEEIPGLTVYPVDVDQLNLEFSHTGEFLYFYLNGDQTAFRKIDEKVATLCYDFSSPLTITLTNGQEDKEITILPAGYTRKVMLSGEQYYYITNDGVCSASSMLPGDFIHLYAGKALTRSGDILDVQTGRKIGSAGGVQILQEATPIQAFEYGGEAIKTFGAFSIVGGGAERSMQIFQKDGALAVVDGSIDCVRDGVLLGAYQNEQYQVVLGTNGVLYNLKDPVHLPDNFKNAGIKALASNLGASSRYLLVEYENGGTMGVDYVTGEVLFEDRARDNTDFLAFARAFFSFEPDVLSEALPEVYGQVEAFMSKLEQEPVENLLKDMGISDGGDSTGMDGDLVPKDTPQGGGFIGSSAGGSAYHDSGAQYIPYYNAASSEYELYRADELLGAGESVKTENQKIAEHPALVQYYAPPSTHVRASQNVWGIAVLGAVGAAIIGGVIYLLYRRRRLR